MCSGDDVGDEIEEEGEDDSDMVDFEEEGFAFEAFGSLLWLVVEEHEAAAGWVGVVVPVDLFFGLEAGLACSVACV